MSKHKIFIYRKLNDGGDYDYADGGGYGIYMNHRPMVGDVIIQIDDGYPWETVIIENLILLREERNNDDISYWHAYCDSIDFDFTLSPHYGKSNDYPKLAAHAIEQRAITIGRYGDPPDDDDIESYENKCKDGVREKLEEFTMAKRRK